MKFCVVLLAVAMFGGHCYGQQSEFKQFEKIIKPSKITKAKPKPKKVWPDEKISSRWTWPGYPSTAALRKHLLNPPHRLDVHKLTNRQVVDLHEKEHDKIGPTNQTIRNYPKSNPHPRTVRNCPT
jgi:hypothetical protein